MIYLYSAENCGWGKLEEEEEERKAKASGRLALFKRKESTGEGGSENSFYKFRLIAVRRNV